MSKSKSKSKSRSRSRSRTKKTAPAQAKKGGSGNPVRNTALYSNFRTWILTLLQDRFFFVYEDQVGEKCTGSPTRLHSKFMLRTGTFRQKSAHLWYVFQEYSVVGNNARNCAGVVDAWQLFRWCRIILQDLRQRPQMRRHTFSGSSDRITSSSAGSSTGCRLSSKVMSGVSSPVSIFSSCSSTYQRFEPTNIFWGWNVVKGPLRQRFSLRKPAYMLYSNICLKSLMKGCTNLV